jgi:peptidyl-prolyl cis-trans isomerase D
MQRQARRAITNEEARQIGLDRQVLARLMTGAALDQDAKRLGLAVSDAEIAKTVRSDKTFAGPNGAFDQARMTELLRDNGYTESRYVREQREFALRQQISDAVAGGLKTPGVLLSAVNAFANETRKADYFILALPDLAKAPAPSEEAVRSFYDMRKDSYRSPEYRTVNVLIVTPADVAKALQISDDAAKKVYDQTAAQRYVTPEKRTITQLTFADEAAAAKAREKIDSGESFDDAARESGGVLADIGAITQAAMFDKSVADAAFALPQPGVTQPIPGKFGVVLARVSEIQPGATKPFDEVKDQIKSELAQTQGKAETQKIHDQIEDVRAAGKTLAQAAEPLGLNVQTVVTDASGAGKGAQAGQPGAPIPALAAAPELVKAIFASDVGVDNEAVSRKDGGYAWFEVSAIDPTRPLSLDDVRPQVVKALTEANAQKELAAKANEMARKIDAGESLASLAAANGVSAQQTPSIKRGDAPGLTPSTAQQIFGTPVGGAGVALADGGGRVVFKVVDSSTPPLDTKDALIAGLLPQLNSGLADDVFGQYISGLQTQLGAQVNQTALRAVGGQE